MEEYIAKGGKLEAKKCKWGKCCKKEEVAQEKKVVKQRQNQVFEYSIVDHDKEFPEVVAPQPVVQTYRVEKQTQQMV